MTFLIAGVGIAISLPDGIVVALARRSRMPFLRACVIAHIELVRSVPLVAVLFFAVTMTPLFLPPDVVLDKLMLVLVAVSIFATAYMAEVVRGGLQAVPLGQIEAGQSTSVCASPSPATAGYWSKAGIAASTCRSVRIGDESRDVIADGQRRSESR